MKILLYEGGKRLVRESGVGRALSHQEKALSLAGVHFTTSPTEDYDIAHINTVLPDAFLLAVRARRAGKQVVWHGHSTMEDFRNSFIGSNAAAPLFQKWLCKCYGQADLVITPTEYSRRILTGYGLRPPIIPVSNGVDTGFFRRMPEQRFRFRQKYGLKENDKAILCVGLPLERKGLPDMLAIAERLPQYRFFWCGHASSALLPSRIRTAIQRASPNVRFLGYLQPQELRDAYGGCDLFFFPTYEETEGIVMLEALSMQIPVLVRDIPVYGDWLSNGVEVHKARTQTGFIRRIRAILDGNAPDLSTAARKAAEERDLQIIGQRLAHLYRTLV